MDAQDIRARTGLAPWARAVAERTLVRSSLWFALVCAYQTLALVLAFSGAHSPSPIFGMTPIGPWPSPLPMP